MNEKYDKATDLERMAMVLASRYPKKKCQGIACSNLFVKRRSWSRFCSPKCRARYFDEEKKVALTLYRQQRDKT